MNALAKDVHGDYDVRGARERGLDILFAPDRLSDTALSAAILADRRFDPRFPGWALYRTIVNGTDGYRPDLNAYAIGLGAALAAAESAHGRRFVKSGGPWVSLAALDAMERCISGSFPDTASARAALAGIDDEAYSRVRNALAGGFIAGFETFRSELHVCVIRVIHRDGFQTGTVKHRCYNGSDSEKTSSVVRIPQLAPDIMGMMRVVKLGDDGEWVDHGPFEIED